MFEDKPVRFPSVNNQQKLCNGETSIPLLPDDPASSNSGSFIYSTDDAFPTYPTEHKKTALALCLITMSTMFCGLVAAFVTDYVPRTPMPDIIFQVLPEQVWAWRVSDMMTMGLLLVNIAFSMLNKHRSIITRRFCMVAAQLYLLRGVCMAVTWVSVPGKYHASRCVPPADPQHYWSTMLERISQFMLSFGLSAEKGGDHHLCGDLIYSGHTLVLVLSWHNINLHVPFKKCRWVRVTAGLCTLGGMFAIILCRMHYTVDVLLAFIITTMYFLLYQIIIVKCQGHQEKQWRPYVALLFWLLPFIDYFERNVPKTAPLPRTLEWPFVQPLFMRLIVKRFNDRNDY